MDKRLCGAKGDVKGGKGYVLDEMRFLDKSDFSNGHPTKCVHPVFCHETHKFLLTGFLVILTLYLIPFIHQIRFCRLYVSCKQPPRYTQTEINLIYDTIIQIFQMIFNRRTSKRAGRRHLTHFLTITISFFVSFTPSRHYL